MKEFLSSLLILYMVGNIAFPFSMLVDNLDKIFFAPNHLYDSTKMNMFGCYMTSLFFFIMLPAYCVPATIIWFVWWMFHIGRKNKTK